jgi:hypothetical protein
LSRCPSFDSVINSVTIGLFCLLHQRQPSF